MSRGFPKSSLYSLRIQDFTSPPWLLKVMRYLSFSMTVSVAAEACLAGRPGTEGLTLSGLAWDACGTAGVPMGAGDAEGWVCCCSGPGLGCGWGGGALKRNCIKAMPTKLMNNTSSKRFSEPGSCCGLWYSVKGFSINLSARDHTPRERTDYSARHARLPAHRREELRAVQLPRPHIPNSSVHNGRKPEAREISVPCSISTRQQPVFSC